jgi:hypothetical protein
MSEDTNSESDLFNASSLVSGLRFEAKRRHARSKMTVITILDVRICKGWRKRLTNQRVMWIIRRYEEGLLKGCK